MIITLIKPLLEFYPHTKYPIKENFLNHKSLKLERFSDNRFKINRYLKKLKSLSSHNQIKFMKNFVFKNILTICSSKSLSKTYA